MKNYTPNDFPHLSNAQANRTAAQINSMHPTVAERFYNSVTEFNNDPDNVSQGRVIAVSSGYRSPAESDRIKATSPGPTAQVHTLVKQQKYLKEMVLLILISQMIVDTFNQ